MMIIAELFVIVKNWKQPSFPVGRIYKLWYIHKIEYYIAIQLHELNYIQHRDRISKKKTHPVQRKAEYYVIFTWIKSLKQ